jgi:SAM-dependent methyltransferase
LSRTNDPDLVRAEYADESRFAVRAAAWSNATGPSPVEMAFQAVAETTPARVLEVGCGRGELAERMQKELGAAVVAVDQSERMLDLYVSNSVMRSDRAGKLPRFEGSSICSRLSAVFVAETAS